MPEIAEPAINPYQMGKLGEVLVTDLLPCAIHVNSKTEKHLPYDIIWGDVRIDVKTTFSKAGDRPLFNLSINSKSQGVILVFLLVRDNTLYLWADRCADKTSTTRYLEKAVSKEALPQLIREIVLTPDTPITISSPFKTLSFPTEDFNAVDEVRKQWVAENKVHISIAKMLRLAVEEYKEKHGY